MTNKNNTKATSKSRRSGPLSN